MVLIIVLSVTTGYETARPVEVELDGVKYPGTYRVMAGLVIVYWRDKVKFAAYGTTPPERLARWLLRDICLKAEVTKLESAAV